MQNNNKITFSFIIINYNAYDYTAKCIKSINQFCVNHDYEINLIDNASSDGSVEKLETEFKEVVFIKNNDNYGFARACNQGIERSSGEFLILLNNDFEFTTDIFARILEKFDRVENLGLLGFQLLNSDGTLQRTCFIFPKISRRILQITIVPLLRKRMSVLATAASQEDQIVDYLKGALMIVPANLLNQLDLRFNENYFMYHEEMDLAFQLRKRGKICLLDPTPAGIHYGMNVEDVINPDVCLWRNQNLLYFVKKNYGTLQAKMFALVNIKVFSIKWLFSFRNSNRRTIYKKVIRTSLKYL